MQVSEEHEKARALRRSAAWKAEKAELEHAIAADEDEAKAAKKIADAHKREDFVHGPAPRILLSVGLGILVLLLAERMLIEQRVATCANPRVVHNYGCADAIAGSFWVWLLPSDLTDQLHAAQEAFHGR
jgi:hypothetical protein